MKRLFDTPAGKRAFALSALAVFAVCCIGSCADESEPTGVGPQHPYGIVVASEGCKLFDKPAEDFDAPSNRDCVAWTYGADGTLALKHVNAGFNCCPGALTADITISDDAITIVEHEQMNGCRCLCLFDVRYKVFKLPAGTYTIRFVELYELGDPPLAVTVDLASNPTGSFCVPRTHYPWYEPSGSRPEPQGRLVRASGCGGDPSLTDDDTYATDLSCVEWRLSEGGVLRLRHLNAGFNCCAEIGADISVEEGLITIVEHESGPPCDCLCLYDIEYEFAGIPAGTHRVRFVELYTSSEDELLDFPVDFSVYPAGVQCAYRTHYPWGYSSSLPEDEARLAVMQREIVDFIGVPSCGAVGDCRHIGIGSKPCGGPWSYLIYSAATIDEHELRSRVLRYNAWNHGMNRRYGLVSTCDVAPEPRPGCVGGVCADLDAGPR